MREFKYLEYTLNENEGQEAHVRERRKKAAIVMREIWGIEKRIWGKNWKRRVWLRYVGLDRDMEVWGWRERREMEEIHESEVDYGSRLENTW